MIVVFSESMSALRALLSASRSEIRLRVSESIVVVVGVVAGNVKVVSVVVGLVEVVSVVVGLVEVVSVVHS